MITTIPDGNIPEKGKSDQYMNPAEKPGKKICIATPEFPPEQWGGLARTVERVARHAADMGLDVHVAHLVVDSTGPVLLDENRETRTVGGITVHRIRVGKETMTDSPRELWDCPHNMTLQMMYQSLEMLHRDEGFDLFHSFFLYPVGFVAGMLAARMHVASIVTVVGNDIKKYIFSPEKVAVCRSGLENADIVVALSRDLVEMAHALTPMEGKARVIYNSVEIPGESWSRTRNADDSFRIGCAGIFKYAKGLPYLFKAVAQLGSVEGLRLELRGQLRDSERAVFEHMRDSTGLGTLCHLLEPLAHERIPEWLRTLDVFVLPSLTEGCPNILMEAMASGVPSIATRTGAVEDLMQDRVSGLLVPWGDSQALAAALREIMDNPRLAQELGSAGRTRMKEFSPSREREAWEKVYRELLSF
ncbi:MAG: glycosyltransferase [Desulfomonile tiedjei]|nr:glycosyltransferase [Desulfomonile tiedjei]